MLLLVGLVVAAGAFLTGPSTAAVRTRRAVGSGIGWVRDPRRAGRAAHRPGRHWTAAHKTLLRVAAVGVAALIFVFWGQPHWPSSSGSSCCCSCCSALSSCSAAGRAPRPCRQSEPASDQEK